MIPVLGGEEESVCEVDVDWRHLEPVLKIEYLRFASG